jgi:VanZ family protein
MLKNRQIFKKEAYFWMLASFWAGLIWGLSSLTPRSIPSIGIDFPFAQATHFSLYFIFSFFLLNAFSESGMDPDRVKTMVFVFLVCLLYGVLDEIHQSFVPGRHPSAYDVFLDGAGALSFLALRRIRIKFFSGHPKTVPDTKEKLAQTGSFSALNTRNTGG